MSIFWTMKRKKHILLSKNHKNTKNHGNSSVVKNQENWTESALFTSFQIKGSLTIEAAITVPIFIFLLTTFLSFLFLFMAQTKLQNSMEVVAQRCAVSYYAIEHLQQKEDEEQSSSSKIQEYFQEAVLGVATQGILGELVKAELSGEWISYPIVEDGVEGVSFWGSGYEEDSGNIVIQASYKMNVPFFPKETGVIRISQSCERKAWNGKAYEEQEEDDPWVYITTHGTVYHTDSNCSHIHLSINSISASMLETSKNNSGEKYLPCKLCKKGEADVYFVTVSGDRYHLSKNCSGLKREVKAVRLSEVGELPLCQRCKEGQ